MLIIQSTMLWVGVICGEPVINQLIRRFPVAKLLGGSMILWSALVFGIAFSMSIPPVLAVRFLLGFFESSFQPCLITSESSEGFVRPRWAAKSIETRRFSVVFFGFFGSSEADILSYGSILPYGGADAARDDVAMHVRCGRRYGNFH
jgi:hypothetical protein